MNFPLYKTLPCPDCGGMMSLRNGRYGLLYACQDYPICEGVHSAHQKTGEPMGIPASSATRSLRRQAHRLFDQLWMTGPMERSEAYRWLRRALDLKTRAEAHIGKLDADGCKRLIAAIQRLYPRLSLDREP